MSNLTISEGTRALAGDLSDAAALDLLIDRRLKFSDSTKGKMKLRTLGQAICGAEGGAIGALERLARKGLICIDDAETALAAGCLLEITQIRVTVACRKDVQPELNMEDGPKGQRMKSAEASVPIVRRDRLKEYEREETVGEEQWRGKIVPVHASDTNDEVLSCSLSSWLYSLCSDGTADWAIRIDGLEFTGAGCVAEAWLHWEESIGWKQPLDEWLTEQRRGDGPIELDDDTFSLVVEAMRAKKPDDSSNAIVCNTALSSGTLVVGTKDAKVMFRRVDIGARWPGLQASATNEKPRKGRKKARGAAPDEAVG